jgi:hypothetical protein
MTGELESPHKSLRGLGFEGFIGGYAVKTL